MSGPNPSNRGIPALFTRAGNLVGNYFTEIAAITGTLGGIVAILNGVFGIQLVPYGTALVAFMTSDGFVSSLLLLVLISQVLLYQRVEWMVHQLEEDERSEEQESDEETEEVLTDGGSDMPPRDSKGRFTTRDSGGSNVFLLLLAAVTGYLFGAETGMIDPFAGALLAIAIVSLFQAREG